MFFKRLMIVCCLAGLATVPRTSHADGLARFESPDYWQHDAELTDVFFLNENLGWAVGAQGVILRTMDGGKNWMTISTAQTPVTGQLNLKQKLRGMQSINEADRLQPIHCRFETVHFIDAKTGWVAGGYEYPYINRSRGIVLKTSDGGVTWREIKGLVLPRIKQLQFTSEFDGWAVGDSGSLYKTGIYYTSDGGNTWNSPLQGNLHSWVAGASISNGYVLLDQHGKLFKVTGQKSESSVILEKQTGRIHDIELLDNKRGLAVGDEGTLLKTENGGLSWARPSQFDSSILKRIDLRSLTSTTDKFWIVGHPGSCVVSIDKRTGQLKIHKTPSPAPLTKIVFSDEQHGWAVGTLGTIIATQDGGQTWHRQRGLNRVAMLNVMTTEAEVPLELLAKYANEEEILSANAILGLPQQGGDVCDRLRQATERLGNTCSLRIPMHAEDEDKNIESLVRTIRSLQPNVVTTPANLRCASLVKFAISQAADRDAFPEHIRDLGLAPWQVDRLATETENGQLTLNQRLLLPRSGQLIEDQIAVSRALLGLEIQTNQKRSYQITNLSSSNPFKSGDLFEGLTRFGNEISKRKIEGRRGNLGVIRHTSQKHKILEQLASLQIKTPRQSLDWRRRVQAWIGFVPPETASIWILQLAQNYLDQGQPELAANAIDLVANRWPDHAFGPACMKWLIQYYSSAEFTNFAFRHLPEPGSLAAVENASETTTTGLTAVSRDKGVVQSIWVPIPQKELVNEAGIEAANAETPAFGFDEFANARRQQASLYMARMRQRDPDLLLSPEFRFVEAQLTLQQYGVLPASNLLKQLSKRVGDYPQFALASRREINIHDENQSTNTQFTATKTEHRPYLDGKLDDKVWEDLKQSSRFVLRSPLNAKTPGADRIGFAYDSEFLYVAAVSHKIKGQSYASFYAKSPIRDPDLSRRDRIEINLDTDRDYCTSMQFTVDCRGWASESCSGCGGWDPDWFVACSYGPENWVFEAAIPLEHLAGTTPQPGEIWAINLRRLSYDSSEVWKSNGDPETSHQIPGRGLQGGLTASPDRFQLLEFE